MPPSKKRPTKPRDFKAEYARRISNAAKAGKTRQAARGHKTHEHLERREREKEQNEGLTNDQIRSIRHFYQRFNPNAKKPEPDVGEVIDFARQEGYSKFIEYRKTWDAARRVYLREQSTGKYSSRGEGYLQMLADMAGVMSVGDIQWLYYH